MGNETNLDFNTKLTLDGTTKEQLEEAVKRALKSNLERCEQGKEAERILEDSLKDTAIPRFLTDLRKNSSSERD